jgi:hypothetical protein
MPTASAPDRRLPQRSHAYLLGGLIAFFIGVYAAWYPRTFSILDEQAFLSLAVTLTKCTVYADVAGVDSVRTISIGEHLAPRVGLGTSLLFAPIVNWNWRACFAIVLGVHLVGVLACAGALRKVELPVWYAALYLFHPVAALYSRTATSDVPTMALTMLGLWLYLQPRSRPFLAGLCWGLMPHFRFAQVVAIAALGAAVFLRDLIHSHRVGRIELRRTLVLGAGLCPGVLLWLALNTIIYGGPLDTPISWPLSAEYLPVNLPRYLLSQNLIYPLALLVALFFPSRVRLECVLLSVALLGLYGCFKHLYQGFGPASILIGDRFFLPLFPLVVIPYAGALDWLLSRSGRWAGLLTFAGLGVLATLYVAVSISHGTRLDRQSAVQDLLYDSTPPGSIILLNPNAREYFFAPLGDRAQMLPSAFLPEREGYDPETRRLIRDAIPDVYVFTAVRSDREDLTKQRVESILNFAREHYEVEELAQVNTWPDQIHLLRLTAERP